MCGNISIFSLSLSDILAVNFVEKIKLQVSGV